MFLTEYDEEETMQLFKEEYLAEGRAEGLREGRAEGLREGRAEGLREGQEKGRAEGLDASVKKLAEHYVAAGEAKDLPTAIKMAETILK